MRPRLACVSGLVDAIADRQIGTVQSFAAADIDHVRVRRRDGYRTDGAGRLRIKDRLPCAAEIVSLPDAAVAHTDIELAWPPGHASDRFGSSAAIRPDAAPLQRLQQLRLHLR